MEAVRALSERNSPPCLLTVTQKIISLENDLKTGELESTFFLAEVEFKDDFDLAHGQLAESREVRGIAYSYFLS